MRLVLALAALLALALALRVAWSDRALPRDGAGPLRVAVLPFLNLSSEETDDYLADGMTDVLIIELSQLHSLRVISRTTAMAYKGSTRPLLEIAEELELDAAVEGSVLLAGQRVRINAQLVDTAADRNLWARSYDCDLVDLLDVQRRVAREISQSVSVSISEREQRMLARSSPLAPDALEAYIRGRLAREHLTDHSLAESRRQFERAIRLAPDYPEAWAALADVHRVIGAAGYDSVDPRQSAPLARAAAERALELDPEQPLAHAALGMLAFDYDWNWSEAEAHLSRALALRPSFSYAHLWYSGFLTAMGRLDEAIAFAERARELDPLSSRPLQTVGYRLYYAGRLAEAQQPFREALQREPGSFTARLGLGLTLWRRGETAAALEELERAADDSSGNAWALGSYGHALGGAGRFEEAQQVLARLDQLSRERHVSPYALALVHIGLGQNQQALDALERAYVERSGWMPFLAVEPQMDPLRGEARFEDLLARVGLPSQARGSQAGP